jgi:hypothetical protein
MEKVVDIKTKSLELEIKRYIDTGILTDLIEKELPNIVKLGTPSLKRDIDRQLEIKQITELIYNTDEFITRYVLFIENMSTRSSKFMFPTILSRYKKGINPVHALYNSTQEVILTFQDNNITHTWLIELFDNEEWVMDLISATYRDLTEVELLLADSTSIPSARIRDDIKFLKRLSENLRAYIFTFESVSEWKKDNI